MRIPRKMAQATTNETRTQRHAPRRANDTGHKKGKSCARGVGRCTPGSRADAQTRAKHPGSGSRATGWHPKCHCGMACHTSDARSSDGTTARHCSCQPAPPGRGVGEGGRGGQGDGEGDTRGWSTRAPVAFSQFRFPGTDCHSHCSGKNRTEGRLPGLQCRSSLRRSKAGNQLSDTLAAVSALLHLTLADCHSHRPGRGGAQSALPPRPRSDPVHASQHLFSNRHAYCLSNLPSKPVCCFCPLFGHEGTKHTF